jgi:coproporphyrinogen III oxidase-like Fe-S oxidoreductase
MTDEMAGAKWIKLHHKAVAPFNRFKKTITLHDLHDYKKVADMFSGRHGALYIHVPFCKQNCPFCILYHEPPVAPSKVFTNAVLRELKMHRDYCIEVMYFGGGTPTLLSIEDFRRILGYVFEFSDPREITIETTVSDFTEEKARVLSSIGVNRVSFGIQSFSEEKRKILGRRSSVKRVMEKIRVARKYFDVVSIDLLYDLPYGNVLLDDVEKAVELGINGISLYPLIYNKLMSRFPHPTIDENERDFIEAVEYLEEHGYKHLSINHFTDGKDKFLYSKYFTCPEKPLLGIGPGAGGHIGIIETYHPPGVMKYIENPYIISVSFIPFEIFEDLEFITKIYTGRTIVPEKSYKTFELALKTIGLIL